MDKELIKQKIKQTVEILNELNIDVWMIFVNESNTVHDPTLDIVVGTNATWQSAFLIAKDGSTTAIVGSLEEPGLRKMGIYDNVIGYVQSVREPLREYMQRTDPKTIALNYSLYHYLADGLTHGLWLSLQNHLKDTPFPSRFVSSEKIVSALRGRKSVTEVNYIQQAIDAMLTIYNKTTGFLQAGKTELEVGDYIKGEMKALGLEPAWDEEHCPAVYAGPDVEGAHSGPTNRVIEKGHVVNMDSGVKVNGYCSDLQRTWYILRDNETEAPPEVQRGFAVIHEAISRAANTIKPGIQGWQVDDVARSYIVSQGYEEFQHGLGHQVGRIVHDGGAGLFPRWEKYGELPMIPLEKGQIFTIEPRLPVKGHGVVTMEEMIQVTDDGCVFLSQRQEKLWYVK